MVSVPPWGGGNPHLVTTPSHPVGPMGPCTLGGGGGGGWTWWGEGRQKDGWQHQTTGAKDEAFSRETHTRMHLRDEFSMGIVWGLGMSGRWTISDTPSNLEGVGEAGGGGGSG